MHTLVPNILLDQNIPDKLTSRSSTDSVDFNLEVEKEAFAKLQEYHNDGKVILIALDELLASKFCKETPNDIREKMSELFAPGIERMIHYETKNAPPWPEYEQIESELRRMMGGEKQDDPSFFLYVYMHIPDVTHIATYDKGLPNKQQDYLDNLIKMETLDGRKETVWQFIRFQRTNKYSVPSCHHILPPLTIGYMSKVLRDVRRRIPPLINGQSD